MLNRLKLEGANTKADVVLGLDTNLTAEAQGDRAVRAARHRQPRKLTLPDPWTDELFLPYDYAHFAVVYDTQDDGDAAEEPR